MLLTALTTATCFIAAPMQQSGHVTIDEHSNEPSVLFLDGDGNLELYRRDHALGWARDLPALELPGEPLKIRALSVHDFGGDGDDDVAVITSEGTCALLERSAGRFLPPQVLYLGGSGPLGQSIQWVQLVDSAAESLVAHFEDGSSVLLSCARDTRQWSVSNGSSYAFASASPVIGPMVRVPRLQGSLDRQYLGSCMPVIADSALPGQCLEAASVPELGKLFPVSPDWFIDAQTGNVGLGTTTPDRRLHVLGGVRGDSMAVWPQGGPGLFIRRDDMPMQMAYEFLVSGSGFGAYPIRLGRLSGGTLVEVPGPLQLGDGLRFPDGSVQSSAQLVGPPGPPGAIGAPGAPGAPGLDGAVGPQGPAGTVSSSFTTIVTPLGTGPQASLGDTLNLDAGANMNIIGSSASDTITFSLNDDVALAGEFSARKRLEVENLSGNLRALVSAPSSGNGIVEVYGPSSATNPIAFLNASASDSTKGAIGVIDPSQPASSNIRAAMFVAPNGDGHIFADIKNFRMQHPSKPGMDIWYACPEGPEAAAYIRGSARLVNGHCTVVLPEHFSEVAISGGMTVQLTPSSALSRGLSVTKRSNQGFVVQELQHGQGDYAFDYLVHAPRRGHDEFRVVRPTSELAIQHR